MRDIGLYSKEELQWRSQDEQVTWAQHGHIQCARNMHLLGKLGHAPAMKIFITLTSLLRMFLATNTIVLVLPVCSLHVHMKEIAYANNLSLTLAFHIIFTRAPVNFTPAQAWVCPGVATPLKSCCHQKGFGCMECVHTSPNCPSDL